MTKKVKNQHDLNGRTDFLVAIIELLRFLNCTWGRNHLPKFEILTCVLNEKS